GRRRGRRWRRRTPPPPPPAGRTPHTASPRPDAGRGASPPARARAAASGADGRPAGRDVLVVGPPQRRWPHAPTGGGGREIGPARQPRVEQASTRGRGGD